MPRKAASPSLADTEAAPGGVAAADKALSLLNAFRAGDAALSLTELAERTQLYKSTALRLLASLEHARLLQRGADGRYALGPGLARLTRERCDFLVRLPMRGQIASLNAVVAGSIVLYHAWRLRSRTEN